MDWLFSVYPLTLPAAVVIAVVTRKDLALVAALVLIGSEVAYRTASSGFDVIVSWAVLNMLLAVVSAQHYRQTRERLAVVCAWIATAGVGNVLAMAVLKYHPLGLTIAQHVGGILTITLLAALVFMDGRRDFVQDNLNCLRRHLPRHRHGVRVKGDL